MLRNDYPKLGDFERPSSVSSVTQFATGEAYVPLPVAFSKCIRF